MSFADALNESMSSSPSRWDPNIDPTLQNTPRRRDNVYRSVQTPSHTLMKTPAQQSPMSWPSSDTSNQSNEQLGQAHAGREGTSSDDNDDYGGGALPPLTEAQTAVQQLAQKHNLNPANTQELMNFAVYLFFFLAFI